MLRIAILEDNNDDAARLTNYLRRYETSLDGAQTFDIQHKSNCLEFLDNYKSDIDIIFFDIDMPHINGMEAAQEIYLSDKNVIIIFVTNLKQYAIMGYQVEALGYLLKPLEYQRLVDIMDKALRRTSQKNDAQITIQNGDNIARISVADILYVEVIGHTLVYHTTYGEYKLRGRLSEKEEELSQMGFARCNRGYIVNLRHVKNITKDTVTVHNDELIISRGKQKVFTEQFLRWLSGNS